MNTNSIEKSKKSLDVACLQIYRKWLLLATCHGVDLNSKEKSYHLEENFSYQANFFVVNYTSCELTLCEISHICPCDFNFEPLK